MRARGCDRGVRGKRTNSPVKSPNDQGAAVNKVVLCMSMSLDGFIAAADDGPGRGLGVGGEPLHAWLTDGNDNPDSRRPGEGLNAEVFDDMKSGVR